MENQHSYDFKLSADNLYLKLNPSENLFSQIKNYFNYLFIQAWNYIKSY